MTECEQERCNSWIKAWIFHVSKMEANENEMAEIIGFPLTQKLYINAALGNKCGAHFKFLLVLRP